MDSPTAVRVLAPAKVNLYLRVTGKRPDGYHNLVSVMQALELADELTVEKAAPGTIEVSCDNPSVPQGTGNIAFRAAEAMARFGAGGARVRINKRVPMAAGLGGGSSDAAAVMRAAGLLYGLSVPADAMREAALSLGADVPFFLGTPSALARGVGEELTPLEPPAESWLVLVNPGIAVPTAWVYGNLNLVLTNPPESITLSEFKGRSLCAGPTALCLHNDLERVTAGKYPLINVIKERLAREGAAGTLMSGSGSTVFGLFCSRDEADGAAARISTAGWTVIVTRTISVWPEPEFLF